jgi:putative endonuclease
MTKAKRSKAEPAKKSRKPRRPAGFVYVLGCFGGPRAVTYVGWTNDVAKRLTAHNAGKGARSTRGRAWVLLHSEPFGTRQRAMRREWHLKRDRKFRKQLVESYLSKPDPALPT